MILQSHRALQARPKDSNTVKRSSVVTKVHIHALVLTEPGRRCGRPVCADRREAQSPPRGSPRTAGGRASRRPRGPCPWARGALAGPAGASRGKRPFLGLPSRSGPAIDRASGGPAGSREADRDLRRPRVVRAALVNRSLHSVIIFPLDLRDPCLNPNSASSPLLRPGMAA